MPHTGNWACRFLVPLDESFAVFTINALKCMPTLCDEPKLRPSAERLAEIITSLQRCLILKLSKELSRGNVSFPQYCLLGMLREEKQLTMSEIAQRMGHSTAAATGLIDRLENLGHVRRTHAKDDRRKVLLVQIYGGSVGHGTRDGSARRHGFKCIENHDVVGH